MNAFTLSLWENFQWGLIHFDQFTRGINLEKQDTQADGYSWALSLVLISFYSALVFLRSFYVTALKLC